MTRQLHDTLRQLGYDRALEEAAKAIPDARQRLAYVAQMTEQAASRVLNATDVAKPIQDKLQSQAAALSGRWDRLLGGDLSVEEFKVLAGDTRAYLGEVPRQTAATNDQLMEIMMAQDFQDLTGQVIKKIVDLAQSMERDLLQVLIEAMPQDMKTGASGSLMNGPAMNAAGRSDVVNSQEQVDDLLESLGF
jgi:chemotaxis protein CheZ